MLPRGDEAPEFAVDELIVRSPATRRGVPSDGEFFGRGRVALFGLALGGVGEAAGPAVTCMGIPAAEAEPCINGGHHVECSFGFPVVPTAKF